MLERAGEFSSGFTCSPCTYHKQLSLEPVLFYNLLSDGYLAPLYVQSVLAR